MTTDNVSLCTNCMRRKLRDFLERNSVPYRKGSSDSMQQRLPGLISASITNRTPAPSDHGTISSFRTARRDILKTPRNKDDLYGGPYSGTILSSVKSQVLQVCTAFKVPENQ